MSRSYRKPYIKDGSAAIRAKHHQKLRRICRQISHKYAKAWHRFIWEYDHTLDPVYPDARPVTN